MDMGRASRIFCRYAAIVFLGVTVYTLIGKGLGERLHHDWAHSVLHIGSAFVTGYAGWATRTARLAVLFTAVLAATYIPLGIAGWFVDGLLLDTPVAVPLGPADNVFHLIVGTAAAGALVVGRSRSDRSDGGEVPEPQPRAG